MSVNGGYYRRKFGNQTFTDDLRYDKSSYDGPFCINAPVDPNLPGGGGYQVCGLYDLKPCGVRAEPAGQQPDPFSDDFGGETNIYQGFDVNLECAVPQRRVPPGRRQRDDAHVRQLQPRRPPGSTRVVGARDVRRAPKSIPTARALPSRYPYRPDVKCSGSYTLPFDIQFSGTYQFSRGVQTGGAGPEHPGELGGDRARSRRNRIGRPQLDRRRRRRRRST